MPIKLPPKTTEDDLVFEGDLQRDVVYRMPRDRGTGHIWSGRGVMAACGVGLWLSDEYWNDSWFEQEFGDQWVVEDKRAAKACAACRRWAEWHYNEIDREEARIEWHPPKSVKVWPERWWRQGTHIS